MRLGCSANPNASLHARRATVQGMRQATTASTLEPDRLEDMYMQLEPARLEEALNTGVESTIGAAVDTPRVTYTLSTRPPCSEVQHVADFMEHVERSGLNGWRSAESWNEDAGRKCLERMSIRACHDDTCIQTWNGAEYLGDLV